MIGLIESVLRNRYGDPAIVHGAPFVEYLWNEKNEALRCQLFKGTESEGNRNAAPTALDKVYGDALGGFLLLDSVKVAMLRMPSVYGLYLIGELQAQPELCDAKRIDPAVEFFMDAASVWFYGVKQGRLFVYDAETGELDSLGPLEQAISTLLAEWERAKRP